PRSRRWAAAADRCGACHGGPAPAAGCRPWVRRPTRARAGGPEGVCPREISLGALEPPAQSGCRRGQKAVIWEGFYSKSTAAATAWPLFGPLGVLRPRGHRFEQVRKAVALG